MPVDQASRTPCITVVYNKTTTVLEMEHNVVDFITLCESPYVSGKYTLVIIYEWKARKCKKYRKADFWILFLRGLI